MATIAISSLPAATAAAVGDVLPIVQGGTTKQVTNALLFTNATLVAPALGTVASGNISACTSTGMVLTAPVLGTVASGNISACTSTSMAMVTPVIGAATGTSLSTTGNQVITGAGKLGYATGSGGIVTQLTSKSTGVTLNKSNGQIVLNNAALAASTTVSFTLTSTSIESGDILIMNHLSAGTAGSYSLNAQSAAGSASINVRNISLGSLSEAIIIVFAVVKSVAA
jgi:hypothetical protein